MLEALSDVKVLDLLSNLLMVGTDILEESVTGRVIFVEGEVVVTEVVGCASSLSEEHSFEILGGVDVEVCGGEEFVKLLDIVAPDDW